jgi:hypothetical protein
MDKTKPTRSSVAAYIDARANAQQKKDCRELMALMKKITGKQPRMWGPSIVGFDSYRYTLASGKPSEVPLACFAIRGKDLVVYLYADSPKQKALRAKLGKHSMGKSCLYFRQLADLDKTVLERLIVGSIAEFKERHSSG